MNKTRVFPIPPFLWRIRQLFLTHFFEIKTVHCPIVNYFHKFAITRRWNVAKIGTRPIHASVSIRTMIVIMFSDSFSALMRYFFLGNDTGRFFSRFELSLANLLHRGEGRFDFEAVGFDSNLRVMCD